MRHILVANVYFAPNSYGGATVVAEQVAVALVATGRFRVTAVSLCTRRDIAPYTVVKCQKNGIENYLINIPKHRGYGEAYDNAQITMRVAEIIHAVQPDLVHAHCIQDLGTGVILAAEAAQIPVILSVHDFWWLCERQFMIGLDGKYCGQSPVRVEKCKGCVDNFWAARTRFDHLREMSAKASLITYPSRFAKDLCEASGMAAGQGVIWENGVRLPRQSFFQKQALRRANDGRLSFGFVGGPSDIKGWPQIKRAFSDLKEKEFRGLVVEGSLDGSWWCDQELEPLQGEWSIVPKYDQGTMDDFYAEVDVLLFMSQWKETFGLAIREALARGIPVIQTDSGGTVEHTSVDAEKLIPIGASCVQLSQQIEAHLGRTDRGQPVVPVAGFDDQARVFCELVDRILGGLDRAA